MRMQAKFLILALVLVAASQAAFAQSSSGLDAPAVLTTIKDAMLPAFTKLSAHAITWLAAFSSIQFFITNSKLLLGDGDLQAVLGRLVGAIAWVAFCLYVIDHGPGFISAVGDQMFGLVGDMPTPASIMSNTFSLAATVGTLALGVGAIPFAGGTAGNIVVIVMLLVLAVGMYFALKIFMLQLEVGLVAMLSPMSFSLLGLNALRDQGIAPFKSLLSLAYRIVLVGVIVSAFSDVSAALTTTLEAITVAEVMAHGLATELHAIVQAIGAYALLAFAMFKSDALASGLASGTSSLSTSDMTAAAAAGAAAGAVAATGGAAAVASAGKAPQSMASFMDKMAERAGGGSISNASPMGSGGIDAPVFNAPARSLSVGGRAAGDASSPLPPSRPPKANVGSGRFGPDPQETGQESASQAQDLGAASDAAISGPPGSGSSKLEEKLEKLVDTMSQPNKPSVGQQMRELDQRLAHDKATTGVSINAHHD